MDYKVYLIPYTTIISTIDESPALEGTFNICAIARTLTEKFLTWLIGKIQALLTKFGLLKKTTPRSENNALAAKQLPHIDKAFTLMRDAMGDIAIGYIGFKLQPIRSSKATQLGITAGKIDQYINAARGELEIVMDIGGGNCYIAAGTYDDWIKKCKVYLSQAKECKEKVIAYYDKLIRDGGEDIKAASSDDINAFNQSITNYVSFVTVFTDMIMSIQGG